MQVDTLNDDIRRLTKENKEAFAKRMQLEAEKNKLENLLTNNLVRRKDELVQALQEISVEDRQRQLDSSKIQLADIEKRLVKVNEDFKTQNEKVTSAMKKVSIRHLLISRNIFLYFQKTEERLSIIFSCFAFSKKRNLPMLKNGN